MLKEVKESDKGKMQRNYTCYENDLIYFYFS